MFFWPRLDPYGVAVGEEIIKSLLFRDDPATHGDHCTLNFFQHFFKRAPLNGAKARLPIEREDLSEWHASIPFNFTIQLDETIVGVCRQLRPQSGLACSPHADQGDTHPPHLFVMAKVAHQAEYHVLEPMLWQAFQEPLDYSFFRGFLGLWRKQVCD